LPAAAIEWDSVATKEPGVEVLPAHAALAELQSLSMAGAVEPLIGLSTIVQYGLATRPVIIDFIRKALVPRS
jgi:hypothetical protein